MEVFFLPPLQPMASRSSSNVTHPGGLPWSPTPSMGPCPLAAPFTPLDVQDPQPYDTSLFYVVICSGVRPTRLRVVGQDMHDLHQCWVLAKRPLNEQPRA